jgi:hypothetical protein
MKYWYDTEFYEDGERIHLISIGIVADDGREFYAESSDFVWDYFVPQGHWLWENVKPHLIGGPVGQVVRHPKVIAKLVKEFITKNGDEFDNELWGYYSAYDHVVLAQLFGRMVDMPDGVPWFTQDIRQLKEMLLRNEGLRYEFPKQGDQEHHALNDARWTRTAYYDIMRFATEGN